MSSEYYTLRILLVNTLYTPYQIGGAEKSVQSLAESLCARNHTVAIVTLGENKEVKTVENVQVFRLKYKNIYWPFSSKPNFIKKFLWHLKDTYNTGYDTEIREILNDFQPQIVHTHNLGGFSVRIWDLANEFKIPVFHTLRDYYLMSTSTTNLEGDKKLDKFFSRKRKDVSQKVNFVSGISEFILQQHLSRNYFSQADSNVIYNGFDFKEEIKNPSVASEIRFGFIGQVKEHKGIYLLLQAFSKQNNSNSKLLIAGNASPDLINLYAKDTRIEFIGFVNTEEFFQKIDVLVVPSIWHEPFGRVVMEALAHQKPVLGSKMGGIPELLKNNTEFLFQPTAENLELLLKKVVSEPGFLAKFKFDPKFLKEFTRECMVNKYETVYKTLILRTDEN